MRDLSLNPARQARRTAPRVDGIAQTGGCPCNAPHLSHRQPVPTPSHPSFCARKLSSWLSHEVVNSSRFLIGFGVLGLWSVWVEVNPVDEGPVAGTSWPTRGKSHNIRNRLRSPSAPSLSAPRSPQPFRQRELVTCPGNGACHRVSTESMWDRSQRQRVRLRSMPNFTRRSPATDGDPPMSTADWGIATALGTSVARGLTIHARQPGMGLAMPRLAHLAPREVGRSPWFPRNQKTPAAQEQREVLLASIRQFGGNLQPIKVRPVVQRQADEPETRFELVYGSCRLQACGTPSARGCGKLEFRKIGRAHV